MADTRRYLPNQPLDLKQILEESKHRWLRPNEILEIFNNYQLFKLSPEPPVRPSAGSLFLFDRKALRYFRKDGHNWRKKKDGKTVREAHEKLKAGSVDVLHCYYAHGEDNNNFQRRCYWMLDGKLEHIVLVHYREVKEGYRSGVSHLLSEPSAQVDSSQPSSAPSLAQTASPAFTGQTSYASSPNRVDWNGQTLSSESEDVDSRDNLRASPLTEPVYGSLLGTDVEGFPMISRNPPESWFIGSKFGQRTESSLWPEIPSSSKSADHVQDQKSCVGEHSGADFITHKLRDPRLDSNGPDTVTIGGRLISNMDDDAVAAVHQKIIQEHDFNLIPPRFLNFSGTQNDDYFLQPEDGSANDSELGELKKLDSFGRWMDKEIGGDCDDSLMASDSGNYWNTLGAENEEKEVSSLSHHMQLDIESLGPSLSQEQLFSIHDFSPDWAYSGVETKVLIIGTFLGSKKFSSERKWGCMFGEIEVSAEVLTNNVVKCQAPLHVSGRVPFYITCRNRLACSEVREFEYRDNPSSIASLSVRSVQQEELQLQVRLAKLLYLGPERKWLNCSSEGCNKCKRLRSTLYSIRNYSNKDYTRIREDCTVSEVNCTNSRDELIHSLLKDKLCEWLVCKVHEGKGLDVLDDEGQGVMHLAASLGYEWAMGLIVAVSNNPNFRDAQGRTALHWASYFGREETVIALVSLGVDPTAVDDPTPAFPGGRVAADLASNQGHKGIAGYLAEAFLTRQLSSLNINENATNSVDATIAAEQATELAAALVALPSNGRVDDQLSLKGSLAAVRKSALAAALIQATFRSYSFQYRQLPKGTDDSEVSLDLAALGSLNKDQRSRHFEDYLHSAAVKIQQKYRGWKGRKEFLKIRNRIVKIQAHVRGRKVRKQYKKVIWSVSIVEKAILRWRRKRSGLRGFHVEKTTGDVTTETDRSDEYEFLRISRKQKYAGVEKALARVQSMARDPAARDQYMRLVTKSEKLKMSDEGISISRQDEYLQ
ncbi:calmodulin-binding transcription activator 3 isoform X2 [Ricinus communis]|uniref:calmodulin-binding transcription activator 3 isoform X2 n=1 Tax=Ricinus communis TaxID=3988 RepID=UPI000772BC3A|nr:calmodulin-binding transcription activator 3 isoform X2 [Ricinus communis]|eukprot:XP_015574726.1 calmodulin-binding transcription activator 3 isoform X2 [Ricinus communis]